MKNIEIGRLSYKPGDCARWVGFDAYALNEEAAAGGARIIVNPELATTGYAFDQQHAHKG
ncbi:hypothetical protein [Desulfofundulus thermosubterraneus]|uniref:Uncharacterized protein n=1 Tax=Desulfofundulus thermosubterraneus DSM 16057 TaxID=1121432 RepID=A0A1M6JUV8_9FIRM|nr:hypothetical protein [Desulfofundulus thermosubterraneus]SHJ50402.1 hypothetical protein SAMN02745219_02713 [Desulfofundulus thermosubterraneus DSM 16057]